MENAEPLQISFVLPVTLQEKKTKFVNGESWRTSPDNEVVFRTRLLLLSFLKWYDQTALAAFLIICPSSEVTAIADLLRSITSDHRYKVISELEICPEIEPAVSGQIAGLSGWHIQQLIKISSCARIGSPYYVTLDSDIVGTRPITYESFIHNNRALTNVETAEDYRRLYEPQFAEAEIAIKSLRYAVSAGLLGYTRSPGLLSRFYGETPVILHTESVRALMENLAARHGRPWFGALAKRLGWTEYGLYFQFLEKLGKLQDVCELAGCNTVLDLDRSVWQESAKYRQPRVYDVEGWFAHGPNRQGGAFVAIQSWLPVESWLPAGYATVRDYYRRLEESLANA